MPFIGKNPTAGFATIVKDSLTANGSTTQFTLSKQVASPTDIAVFVGNVRQEPTTAYTVNGTTLDFGTGNAPATGLDMYVLHIAGTHESSVVPADGTISSAKLQANAVTSAKLDTNIAISGNLDVGTIRSANGTSALTIDSSGRVLTPARPAFRAFLSSNTGNVDYTSAAASDFVFNSESYDIGGNYNTSNGKFTAPIAGIYHFNANMYGTGFGSGVTWASVYIFVNGVQTTRTINDPEGGAYAFPQITDNLQLTAGQEVTIRLGVSGDSTVNVSGSGDGSITNFSGFLIG